MAFLAKNREKYFSVTEIHSTLNINSYPTVLKAVDILIAGGRVNVKDYGSIKLVSWKEDARR